MWCPARVPSVVGKTFIHVQKFLLFAEEKCLEKSHDSKDSKKRVSKDDWSLLTRNRASGLRMEMEKQDATSKTPEENKELNTKEDVTSRGDTLKPCEPLERAKEPDQLAIRSLSATKHGNVTSENASHDEIQGSCQQLIDDINAKRKRDTDLLNDFKKALEEQINASCGVLEENIVQTYERHSKTIQDKLQELFAVLERISKLENELMDFKHSLGLLYNDMQVV